jgi:hypothetical protein
LLARFLFYTLRPMFIRWKSRKRRVPKFGGYGKQLRSGPSYAYARSGKPEQDVHWSAIIIESVRVDGKPKQRHVAYLAGITESAIDIGAQRAWFWVDVMRRLDGLANRISNDDREDIEAAVGKRVPRPTAAEYEEIVRNMVRVLGPDAKLPDIDIIAR